MDCGSFFFTLYIIFSIYQINKTPNLGQNGSREQATNGGNEKIGICAKQKAEERQHCGNKNKDRSASPLPKSARHQAMMQMRTVRRKGASSVQNSPRHRGKKISKRIGEQKDRRDPSRAPAHSVKKQQGKAN